MCPFSGATNLRHKGKKTPRIIRKKTESRRAEASDSRKRLVQIVRADLCENMNGFRAVKFEMQAEIYGMAGRSKEAE